MQLFKVYNFLDYKKENCFMLWVFAGSTQKRMHSTRPVPLLP